MKKFNSLSDSVKAAYITGAFTIIAAITGGLFVLANKTTSQPLIPPTATSQITVIPSRVPQAIVTNTLVPSPQQIPNPYPPFGGRLALYDPLQDNSKGYLWNEADSTQFGGGAYHVFSVSGVYHRCAAQNTNFSNFTFEVELTILRGACGGMVFRGQFPQLNYYYFAICQNSSFNFSIYTSSTTKSIQSSVPNANIRPGLGQPNLIAVVANNDSITLYVNNQSIYATHDSIYTQGRIGLVAESDSQGTSPTEVVFSNAKVWTLP